MTKVHKHEFEAGGNSDNTVSSKLVAEQIRKAELAVIQAAKNLGHDETCSGYSPYSKIVCDCKLGLALARLKTLKKKKV